MASDARLCLGHRAAEIPAADAELDGDESLSALVINPGCARREVDARHVLQRYVAHGPVTRLVGHLEIADLLDAVAVAARIAHHEVELPVALQDLGRDGAAQGGLDDGVDIARVEAIPRGLVTVDGDVEVGLAEHRENAE